MDDLRQDSQTDLPTEYFAFCSDHFEASFQQKFAYWDTSRFQEVWETFSTKNRREGERFVGQWLPKKWGKTRKSIFPDKRSLEVSLGPYRYPNPPPPPPPPPLKKKRKNDFFSNWIGLFEICFRSSKMTDPRPCPTGWSYLEIYPVQRRRAQVNQQQIINRKNRYFLRVRETSQNKTPPPQTSIGCSLEEKLIYLASSLIILKQARHNSWPPNFAFYPAGASAKGRLKS